MLDSPAAGELCPREASSTPSVNLPGPGPAVGGAAFKLGAGVESMALLGGPRVSPRAAERRKSTQFFFPAEEVSFDFSCLPLPAPPFLRGEALIFPRKAHEGDSDRAFLVAPYNKALKLPVLVVVTSYRVLFLPAEAEEAEGVARDALAAVLHAAGAGGPPPADGAAVGGLADELLSWTPLLNIESAAADLSRDPPTVEILCKDMSVYNVQGMTRKWVQALSHSLTDQPRSLADCVCFTEECAELRRPSFDPARELRRWTSRSGDPGYAARWRVSDANRGYAVCASYGEQVVVPSEMRDEDIADVAKFRKRERFPIVAWVHPFNGASLSRCSQPEVGIAGKESVEDQHNILKYAAGGLAASRAGSPAESDSPGSPGGQRATGVLRSLAEAGRLATMRGASRVARAQTCLTIVDARGEGAAAANRGRGGGTEKAGYDGCQLEFLSIDNIHAMRSSLRAVRSAVTLKQSGIGSGEWGKYNTKLGEAQWFGHLELVLKGARFIAAKIHEEGQSVVIHCSDGWDRTTQLACLASVLLDPHYRTIAGLADAVEKDWMQAGHKFQDRCGTAPAAARHKDEESPIFLQFCECLCQLWHCFPAHFEYTPQLVAFVALHAHSGRFSNFLCNCEQDRAKLFRTVRTGGADIWSHIEDRLRLPHDHVAALWRNPLYRPEATRQPLIPDRLVRPEQFAFQEVMYGRWRAVFEGVDSGLSGGAVLLRMARLSAENEHLRQLLREAGVADVESPFADPFEDRTTTCALSRACSASADQLDPTSPGAGRRHVDAAGRVQTSDCAICGGRFNKLTMRKQTCRACGQVVCERCSRHRVERDGERVRVCDACSAKVKEGDVARALSFHPNASPTASIHGSEALDRSVPAFDDAPPLDRAEYAVDEAWENQRRYPGVGWSRRMFPTDRPPWSSRDGRRAAPLHGYGLPDQSWEWVDDWHVEGSVLTGSGEWDPPGWEYAFDFPDTFAWVSQPTWRHVVRRRKWARTRRRPTGPEQSSLFQLAT
eukprot:TRINITY_DN18210_c0_g1_i1.p1 TRINITY_DN18210_c0_g1~~TRINITY_DN18210_c0_g1_i1.p1  ORF type:complete len:1004 (+),score=346.34 TRINITY_DN18210_c0_g1_i1:128-3139(+)